MKDFKGFYKQHGVKLWFILIFGIIAFLTIGCLFLPEIFWDKFIYRYYWGPVEVDALESGPKIQSDGYEVNQGYTIISEITYGIVLILALFGIYRILERLKIQIHLRFVLSIVPYFFLGGSLRVLEDAELFKEPYVYLFISPLIYFVIGVLILGVLLFFVSVARRGSFSLKMKLVLTGMVWLIFNLIYISIYFFNSGGFNYMIHPLVPIIFSIITFSFLIWDTMKKHEFDAFLSVFLFGLFLLTFSVFVVLLWPSIDPWKEAYLQAQVRDDVTIRPFAGLLVIMISIIVTFCTYIVPKVLENKQKLIAIFTNPINLLIIFGQVFDATATFVGVDFYGYSEKHPIPDYFFQTFGTSAVFIPIKLILACMMVYLIDISFKEELSKYPRLRGLIKIAIIVLGLAPGTRDMLRMMMGV